MIMGSEVVVIAGADEVGMSSGAAEACGESGVVSDVEDALVSALAAAASRLPGEPPEQPLTSSIRASGALATRMVGILAGMWKISLSQADRLPSD
jgi:hypothetical protein